MSYIHAKPDRKRLVKIEKLKPSLSIVIPILNEEKSLPSLLNDIGRIQRSLNGKVEFIIVDGGSSDRSVELCERAGVTVLHSAAGRGRQIAAGAEAASGECLLFLHADCRLTEEHCRTAVERLRHPELVAGGFTLRFDASHPILRFAEGVNKIRFRLTRIFYGDHGIFLRRETYARIGGMPEQALFEDIEFSRKLKRYGRVEMVPLPLTTSARRFRAGGVLRTYLKMATMHILYWLGVSAERLARWYQKGARP